MRDKDENTWEVGVFELTEEGLVEASDPVICVCRRLAIGYSVKEVSVCCSLMPHPCHFRTAGLEVSKILFAKSGFLVDLDLSIIGMRFEAGQHAFCGGAGPNVGGSVELDGVGRGEHVEELLAGIPGLEGVRGESRRYSRTTHLLHSYLRQLYSMVWHRLVNRAILYPRLAIPTCLEFVSLTVALRLTMTNQNNKLYPTSVSSK